MALVNLICALGVLPLALAHMQLSSPSPLRDPHSNRAAEPKDYNILDPLTKDGSNFPCKGYHLNTPLTTVATYVAGGSYNISLGGSATHGGGSCQVSLSCDGGKEFRVMNSMIGNCPMDKTYPIDIPEGLECKQALLAWTWFNKIGNREMYMNCAVVDVVPPRSARSKIHGRPHVRDTQTANAASQLALRSYPELFVANLANINDCLVQETVDVVFDDPGKRVSFGNAASRSAKPSFGRGQCRSRGGKSGGGSKSPSPPTSYPSQSRPPPQNSYPTGQWTPPPKQNPEPSKPQGKPLNCNDGQWHETGCWGTPDTPSKAVAQTGQWKPQPHRGWWHKRDESAEDGAESVQRRVSREKRWDAYAEKRQVAAGPYDASYVAPSVPQIVAPAPYVAPTPYVATAYAVPEPYVAPNSYAAPAAYAAPDPYAAPASYAAPAPYVAPATPYTASADPAVDTTKDYNLMTEEEKFQAFLRRLVELSHNVASLIKYATPSYYTSATSYADDDSERRIYRPVTKKRQLIGWDWPWVQHASPKNKVKTYYSSPAIYDDWDDPYTALDLWNPFDIDTSDDNEDWSANTFVDPEDEVPYVLPGDEPKAPTYQFPTWEDTIKAPFINWWTNTDSQAPVVEPNSDEISEGQHLPLVPIVEDPTWKDDSTVVVPVATPTVVASTLVTSVSTSTSAVEESTPTSAVVEITPTPAVVEITPTPAVVEITPTPAVAEITPTPAVVEPTLPTSTPPTAETTFLATAADPSTPDTSDLDDTSPFANTDADWSFLYPLPPLPPIQPLGIPLPYAAPPPAFSIGGILGNGDENTASLMEVLAGILKSLGFILGQNGEVEPDPSAPAPAVWPFGLPGLPGLGGAAA